MMHGLTDNQVDILRAIFTKHLVDGNVIIYGSRAKGNYTDRSDIDLVISGGAVDDYVIGAIVDDIDDSDFPFLVDLQHYNSIKNPALIEHIDRVGKLLFSMGSANNNVTTQERPLNPP